MTDQHTSLTSIELPRAEIIGDPEGAIRKVQQQILDSGDQSSAYLFLGTSTHSDLEIILRISEAFLDKAPLIRQEVNEEKINELIRFYLDREDLADVDLSLELDNAALRANYLKETTCYTAANIRSFQVGELPQNPSYPAAGWKRENRVFAISFGSNDLFPSFQFQDGVPHPTVKKVIKSLPSDMSAWQTAFWFSSANGWLDGKAPQDCLNETDNILTAAAHLSDPVVG